MLNVFRNVQDKKTQSTEIIKAFPVNTCVFYILDLPEWHCCKWKLKDCSWQLCALDLSHTGIF